MKYTKGEMTFLGKTYEATQADFYAYQKELGNTELMGNVYRAEKVFGLDVNPEVTYKVTQTVLQDGTCVLTFSNTVLDRDLYEVTTVVGDYTQELYLEEV